MKEQYYYDSNAVDFFIYKSMRKNSKCLSLISCFHLISKEPQVNDDAILSYFISKLDSMVTHFKKADSICVSWNETYCKPTQYLNTNNEYYDRNYKFFVHSDKKHYYSIEEFINELYRLFMDIYPYSKLDINTIYNNPSIKYIVKNYYKNTNNN